MKLSIVIPYHNEGKDIIFPLLASIDQQINVNFTDIELLVCAAFRGCPSIDISELHNIKTHIQFLFSDRINEGPGEARNIGLAAANGEYILFCDCDDSLSSNDCLSSILDIIQSGRDRYDFNFNSIDGEQSFVGSNKTPFQLWASVYRKAFLENFHIKFSPTFYGEDLEFVAKVETCNPTTEYCPICIYNYILRNGSAVTMRWHRYYNFLHDTVNSINNIHKWWTLNKIQFDYQLPIFTKILFVILNELDTGAFLRLSNREQVELRKLIQQILSDYKITIYMYSKKEEYTYFLDVIYKLQELLSEVY